MYNFFDYSCAVERYFSARAKFDRTGLQSEKGMVFACGDIVARHNGCAALANDNRAGERFLPIRELNTEVFWI